MSAIGKGDWVECWRGPDRHPVYVGGLYCIEEIVPLSLGLECPRCGVIANALILRNAPAPGGFGWCPNDFRPVYRPPANFIESFLKQPAPERELQDV